MEANHSSVYDRVRMPTRIAEASIADAVWIRPYESGLQSVEPRVPAFPHDSFQCVRHGGRRRTPENSPCLNSGDATHG
jgi:hypothetical protein